MTTQLAWASSAELTTLTRAKPNPNHHSSASNRLSRNKQHTSITQSVKQTKQAE